MAAVYLGSSTVLVIVIIVVKYRLVYQLIGRLQAAKVYLGGSTVPAAVVIVVKHRACLLVSRLIVGVQARSFGQWVAGVQARQLSDLGSSTVQASGGNNRRISAISQSMYHMHINTIIIYIGSSTVLAIRSFGQQYNTSNGVIFRRQIGTEFCRRVNSYIYRREILSGSYAYQYKTYRFIFAGVADIITDITDIIINIADIVNIAGITDRIL